MTQQPSRGVYNWVNFESPPPCRGFFSRRLGKDSITEYAHYLTHLRLGKSKIPLKEDCYISKNDDNQVSTDLYLYTDTLRLESRLRDWEKMPSKLHAVWFDIRNTSVRFDFTSFLIEIFFLRNKSHRKKRNSAKKAPVTKLLCSYIFFMNISWFLILISISGFVKLESHLTRERNMTRTRTRTNNSSNIIIEAKILLFA